MILKGRNITMILAFLATTLFISQANAQFVINDTLAVRVLKSVFEMEDNLIGVTTHNDKGLILFRGNEKYITHDCPILDKSITYYTDSLTLNWKVNIPSKYEIGTEINRLIPTNKYIYHISVPIFPGKPLVAYYTQIDAYTGQTKFFEIADNENYRQYFSNDEAFKMIRVKRDSLYEVININHASLEVSTEDLKLPSIKNYAGTYENTRWIYFGHADDKAYFYKKTISRKIEKKKPFLCFYDVIEYDLKNHSFNAFKIQPQLEGKYFTPSNNYHKNQIKFKKTYKNKVTSTMTPILPSLSDLYFNEQDKSILLIGEYGYGICDEDQCTYEGILFEKYDNLGGLAHSNLISYPDSIRALDPKLTALEYDKFSRRLISHEIDEQRNLFKYRIQIKDKTSRKGYDLFLDYKTGELLKTQNIYNTKKTYFTDITHYDDHFCFERNEYATNKFYFDPKFHSLGDLYYAKRSTVPDVKLIANLELFKVDVGELLIEYYREKKLLNIYHISRYHLK